MRGIRYLTALLLCLASPSIWAQILVQAAGTCGPAQIGQPCATTGPATQVPDVPALNLGADNPVHIVTGNKTRRDTDLPAAAHSPGLEIVRHYNSLDPRAGPLGRGWAGSYDTRLHVVAGLAQIVQADGSRIDFDLGTDPHQGCAPLQAGSGTLTRTDSGWHWRWPDGRQLVFDETGLLARIVRPHGGVLHIDRVAHAPLHGLVLSIRDDSGDALHLSYEIGAPGPRLARVETPRGVFVYDHVAAPDGRGWLLVAVTRPDGMQRRYVYDPTQQNGHAHALTGAELLDRDGRVLSLGDWSYDAVGRIARVGRDGKALRFAYLKTPTLNQPGLTTITSAAGTTLLHTRLSGARYLLTDVTGSACPGCPAPGIQARYDETGRPTAIAGLHIAYDEQGDIARLSVPDSGWPDLTLNYKNGRIAGWSSRVGGERRQRDAARGTLERLHANGDRWVYRQDAQDRPVALDAFSARPGVAPISLRLAWRGTQLSRVQSPHETEQRRYDRRNRLAVRRIARLALDDVMPALNYEDRYRYDALGRLTQHRLPEGGALRYRWQDARLVGIDWIDANARTHAVLRASALGEPGYVHANGLRTQGWTRAGRLAGLRIDAETASVAATAQPPIFAQSLRYDAHGRIDHETFLIDGQTQTVAYAYDAASRLIVSASRDAPQHHYAWRADGSARHASSPIRDASGLPLRVAGRDLQHDALHRLQTVWHDGQMLLQQRHDAQGRRILRHSADDTVSYLYADNRLAAEVRTRNGVTGVTRRYVHAGWLPVAVIDYATPQPLNSAARTVDRRASLYAIHADAVGLPRLLTDQHGNVRWRARFDAFGRAERIEGDLTLDVRLPGQIYDAATGWHDNGLRTHDPLAGHYLQTDPIGPLPGSQAYGYSAQQPRRHADPLGLLLFAFDGTRNTPASMSNVWLLGHAYTDGGVHYHDGPGSPDDSLLDAATAQSAPLILATQWERLLADLSAARFSAKPLDIDLIGYSRGAALARHFSNQIAERVRNGRFWLRDNALGTITACVGLRFIGLFDTVAQFGLLGLNDDNYDLTVANAWQWVAHAVALNEHRMLFPLTSLQGSPDAPGTYRTEAPFIGAHADVGGGYLAEAGTPPREQGDLSNVALHWMRWQAIAAGVAIDDLPEAGRHISRPVMHGDFPFPLRERQVFDREVHDAHGNTLLERQRDHARYGAAERLATDTFMSMPKLRDATTGRYPWVDMDAYHAWLAEETGFDDAP